MRGANISGGHFILHNLSLSSNVYRFRGKKKTGIMYDYGLKCRVEILLLPNLPSTVFQFMAKKEESRSRNWVVDAWPGASIKIGEHFRLQEKTSDVRVAFCYRLFVLWYGAALTTAAS